MTKTSLTCNRINQEALRLAQKQGMEPYHSVMVGAACTALFLFLIHPAIGLATAVLGVGGAYVAGRLATRSPNAKVAAGIRQRLHRDQLATRDMWIQSEIHRFADRGRPDLGRILSHVLLQKRRIEAVTCLSSGSVRPACARSTPPPSSSVIPPTSSVWRVRRLPPSPICPRAPERVGRSSDS